MPVLWAHRTEPQFVVQATDGTCVLVNVDEEQVSPLTRRFVVDDAWGFFDDDAELAAALEALVDPPDDREDRVLEATDRCAALPTVTVGGMLKACRCADIFAHDRCEVPPPPLNRKTTENAVEDVVLADVEPTQELIPIAGLLKYIDRPRRDPPDICRCEMLDGKVRWILQEGHTRTGAALLRDEQTMPMRVWRFTQAADGTIAPVTRGMQRRGEQKRMGLSFNEDGRLDLGDRSKYPGGLYPNEQEKEGGGGTPSLREAQALSTALTQFAGRDPASLSPKQEVALRKRVAATLAKDTGETAAATEKRLVAWAQISGENLANPQSHAEQLAVRQALGAEGTTSHFTAPAAKVSAADVAYVRAEYARTQAYLKEAGITHVTVFRGVRGLDIEDGPSEFEMQPASSWTASVSVANGYTSASAESVAAEAAKPIGHVLVARVPSARILSTPMTGRGALNQQEVIVLGGTIRAHAVTALDYRTVDPRQRYDKEFQARRRREFEDRLAAAWK